MPGRIRPSCFSSTYPTEARRQTTRSVSAGPLPHFTRLAKAPTAGTVPTTSARSLRRIRTWMTGPRSGGPSGSNPSWPWPTTTGGCPAWTRSGSRSSRSSPHCSRARRTTGAQSSMVISGAERVPGPRRGAGPGRPGRVSGHREVDLAMTELFGGFLEPSIQRTKTASRSRTVTRTVAGTCTSSIPC